MTNISNISGLTLQKKFQARAWFRRVRGQTNRWLAGPLNFLMRKMGAFRGNVTERFSGALVSAFLILVLAGCGHGEPRKENYNNRESYDAGYPARYNTSLTGSKSASATASKASESKTSDELEDGEAFARDRVEDSKLYSYTIACQSPDDPHLAELFEKASRLAIMKDEPATFATIEQRLAISLVEGRDILQSQGYYEGVVEGRLEKGTTDQPKAVVRFKPGPRYNIGPSRVILASELAANSEAPAPPLSLSEVGLTAGEPALAADILAAVDRVEEAFRNRGYPRAAVTATRFTLDKSKRVVEAEVSVDPNRFARMGGIITVGDYVVDQSYLEALRTWKIGQPWHQEMLNNYLDALRQSGLFQTVEGSAAKDEDSAGHRPVRLRLTAAAPRTVGGQISYDTDFGPGVNAYWEHRNLTGHGDRLRVDMPLWVDMQQLTVSYRYPYFRRPDQDIIASGGLIHEDTDAYELYSGAIAAGVERRLSRWWRASVMASMEGGSLRDPGADRQEFIMIGLPVSATYDSTNSLLNPTRGYRLKMQASPYVGTYREDFEVVQTRIEGNAFIPVSSDRLVMALRGVWGSVWGINHSQEVPSALRFYSGGGGSVRGYDYQSVGPRNALNEPLGGLSQVEVGAEARLRFGENFGLVAFVDGGMVYANADDEIFQNMLWGAGLGFRYFTAVGPVRLDVALPLDRREGDSSWQMYISLGQSF